jgi:hypothetical protein
MMAVRQCYQSVKRVTTIHISLFFPPNGTTAQGGPRPPLGVSSILPGLVRLLIFYISLCQIYEFTVVQSSNKKGTCFVQRKNGFM